MPPELSPAKVASRIKSANSKVRLEDLAEALINKFGGLEKFADKYVADYDNAKMGSVTRARLLDGALRLVQMVGKRETPAALDEISDEELTAQVADHLGRILKATPIVDLAVDAAEVAKDGPPK